MELNNSTNFTLTSTTQTSSSLKPETTTVFYSDRLFLHTVACQAIAGAFTWAAILITGYHVRLSVCFFLFFSHVYRFRFILIYDIIMSHRNKNGLYDFYLSYQFIHLFHGLV